MSLVGERAPNKGRNEHGQTLLRRLQVCTFFAWVGLIMKFCKNLTGPCGAPSYLPYLPLPTYLPTYLPAYLPTLLMGNKKEIIGRVKVGLLYQLK